MLIEVSALYSTGDTGGVAGADQLRDAADVGSCMRLCEKPDPAQYVREA